MAYYGIEPEQMDQMGRQFESKAAEIQSLVSQLGRAVESVGWSGPDADRFKTDWQGKHAAELKSVSEALRNAAQSIRRNMQEQQSASDR
ncbi:WXG100 family type VII secretion target [Mycolicibacterium llatzerense]|uniref:WXG100 family type VII secretion target n=1 Tax=Mycolicibacterium llatzerense TaxID=280871 RepID=UPI0021B63122|nr:WXG100 family type VII secretion target [Mycolicibacterium llatzerense]MCT7363621.1 hypothetical protein [Mycolicibacterium llatzerense]